MKKIKTRLAALILSALLALTVLTACTAPPDGNPPEDYGTPEEKSAMILAAEDALLSGCHNIDISFAAECAESEYTEDISNLFGTAAMSILHDGDNLKLTLPTASGAATVLLYSNTVYLSAMDIEAMELIRVKAPLNEAQRLSLTDALPNEPRISANDFAKVILTEDGRLLCTDISSSVYGELLKGELPSGIKNVTVDSVRMEISFLDGKYSTVSLTYDMTVQVSEREIKASVTASLEYSYGVTPVIIPENGQSYKTTDYETVCELLGI